MAKNKNSSKKSGKDHYESGKMLACLIIVLTILVAGLTGGLIYAVAHMKTAEEKEYLVVYEHLMQRYPELKCADGDRAAMVRAEEGEEEPSKYNHVCVMTDYGISKDGDPYVSYVQYKYDKNTHEKIDEGTEITLYFQYRNDGYAEALGYD